LGSELEPPLKRGKTSADFQSEGKMDSSRDKLKSREMGTAMTGAAAFKNMGSSPSEPADLLESNLVRFSKTSEVVMGLKEKVPELAVVGESEGAAVEGLAEKT